MQFFAERYGAFPYLAIYNNVYNFRSFFMDRVIGHRRRFRHFKASKLEFIKRGKLILHRPGEEAKPFELDPEEPTWCWYWSPDGEDDRDTFFFFSRSPWGPQVDIYDNASEPFYPAETYIYGGWKGCRLWPSRWMRLVDPLPEIETARDVPAEFEAPGLWNRYHVLLSNHVGQTRNGQYSLDEDGTFSVRGNDGEVPLEDKHTDHIIWDNGKPYRYNLVKHEIRNLVEERQLPLAWPHCDGLTNGWPTHIYRYHEESRDWTVLQWHS